MYPLPRLDRACKTGTCQWQNPLANACDPAPRRSARDTMPGVGRAVRPHEEPAVTGASPTVRQRELGKRLRELRNQHNLTVEEVAKAFCSATKISRLETGARRPNPRDVRDLCRLYGLDESTTARLMRLARDAREPGWWTKYEDLDLDPYIGLEQDATAITCFSVYYIPGLLQTADYARAVISAIAPKMAPDILNSASKLGCDASSCLDDDPPRYHVLLDEAVLRRRVGGSAVMTAQLDKVLDTQRQAKAIIRVIPFEYRRICWYGRILCAPGVRGRLRPVTVRLCRGFEQRQES